MNDPITAPVGFRYSSGTRTANFFLTRNRRFLSGVAVADAVEVAAVAVVVGFRATLEVAASWARSSPAAKKVIADATRNPATWCLGFISGYQRPRLARGRQSDLWSTSCGSHLR